MWLIQHANFSVFERILKLWADFCLFGSPQSNLFFKDEPPSIQDRESLGDRFVSALSIKKSAPSTATSSSSSPSVSMTPSAVVSNLVSSVKKSEIIPAVETNTDPLQVWCWIICFWQLLEFYLIYSPTDVWLIHKIFFLADQLDRECSYKYMCILQVFIIFIPTNKE